MWLIKILTAGLAIAFVAALLVVLIILWIGGRARAERLRGKRWFREGVTALARAGGFSPTGHHWVDRIKHLRGEFGPSPIESFPPWFMVVCGTVAGIASLIAGVRDFGNEFRGDGAWLEEAGGFVLLLLSVFLVYWTWRRSVFENGSVRCLWGQGHVLWREDLTGLQDIICTTRWMKLKWSDHSARREDQPCVERQDLAKDKQALTTLTGQVQ